jgi:hypothetical protein
MTQDTSTNPSYSITKAQLRLYGAKSASVLGGGRAQDFVDISEMIIKCVITQSIESPSISIIFTVTDAIGLLENAPLRGEETIDFSIKTHDTGTEVDLKLVVYKIDGFTVNDGQDKASYELHCITSTTFAASQKEIVAAFKGTSNQIASDIYSNYNAGVSPSSPNYLDENNKVFPFASAKFNNQEDNRFFYVQPGTHIHKLTIPRYRPAKALKFLASKTYSSEAKGTSFRFFENLLGHYFVTDEFLLARGETRNSEESSAISLFYSPIASSDPKYVEDQISRIDNLVQTSKADTPSAMYGGAYKSEVLEIDLINRKTNLKRFDINKDGTNFIDSSGTTRKLSNDPHTEEFANDVFNFDISKRFHVIKTYQEPGDLMFAGGLQNDLYVSEIIQRRAAYNYHLHSHPVIINLKGRLDITAGRILDLDVQGFMSDNRADRDNNQLSGRYLVHSISHECKDDIVTTSARLSKFDWSK